MHELCLKILAEPDGCMHIHATIKLNATVRVKGKSLLYLSCILPFNISESPKMPEWISRLMSKVVKEETSKRDDRKMVNMYFQTPMRVK